MHCGLTWQLGFLLFPTANNSLLHSPDGRQICLPSRLCKVTAKQSMPGGNQHSKVNLHAFALVEIIRNHACVKIPFTDRNQAAEWTREMIYTQFYQTHWLGDWADALWFVVNYTQGLMGRDGTEPGTGLFMHFHSWKSEFKAISILFLAFWHVAQDTCT